MPSNTHARNFPAIVFDTVNVNQCHLYIAAVYTFLMSSKRVFLVPTLTSRFLSLKKKLTCPTDLAHFTFV